MTSTNIKDSQKNSCPDAANPHRCGAANSLGRSEDAPRRPVLHSFCAQPSESLHIPNRTVRKVSFSDCVITSTRVEQEPKTTESSSTFYEKVDVVERRDSVESDLGPQIVIEQLQSMDDEILRDTTLSETTLPVFVVRLGMLKQATVYQVRFTVPDSLPAGELEMIRFFSEIPGHASVPAEIGANCKLLECVKSQTSKGHDLVLELSTTKHPKVNDIFTLRLVGNPSQAVHLILHGLSLGRGQGTPFLRLGIHRIAENPDFEDSDDHTEWPGFVNNIAEEDEEELDEQAGLKRDYASEHVDQGDQSTSKDGLCSSEH